MPCSKLLTTTASNSVEAPTIGHNGGPPLETPPIPSASDIVWGLEGIAAAINRTPAQVRWLIGQGRLRFRKHGRRTISASRKHLHEDCAGEFQIPNR
jgi:hypothetical protein